MTEIKDSALPPAPLKGGPVLCLDIDGVSSPLGQDNRYDLHAPTPGLVPVAGAGHTMQVHPALPEWIAELEQAFAQCVWVSTWRESCRHFAECAGLQGAADWPYLMPVDVPPVPGPPFSSYKLEAVRAWVTPETPVAIVDDHLVDQDYSSHEYREMGESKVLFVQRPGPSWTCCAGLPGTRHSACVAHYARIRTGGYSGPGRCLPARSSRCSSGRTMRRPGDRSGRSCAKRASRRKTSDSGISGATDNENPDCIGPAF